MEQSKKQKKDDIDPASKNSLRDLNEIILSPGMGKSQFFHKSGLSNDVIDGFVKDQTRLLELHIKEHEKTKRIALILGFALILAASTMILFAPEGREQLSYWIGAALVIFAAGTVGYTHVWGKTKNLSFGAGQSEDKTTKK